MPCSPKTIVAAGSIALCIISSAAFSQTDTVKPYRPSFQVGSFNFSAADLRANYTFGSGFNQFGLGGGLQTGPLGGMSQFQLDPSYRHYSNGGSGDIVDINAIYFWNQDAWRFGPVAGYHWNTWQSTTSYFGMNYTDSYNSHAWNFGGYARWFPECNVTGSLHAGYVAGDNSGLYAGLDLSYYFCPEFDLCGGFGYTSYDSWKVFSVRGEYQVSQTVPVAVSAGYNFSSTPNSNQVSLGLKYEWNIPTATTLEDRDRYGLLTGYGYRF